MPPDEHITGVGSTHVMRRVRCLLFGVSLCSIMICASASAQSSGDLESYRALLSRLVEQGMSTGGAYRLLDELTRRAPHRLSGSAGAARAVTLTKAMMQSLGLEHVRLEAVMVPRWERGTEERALLLWPTARRRALSVCALGGSISTPHQGITADVVEVRSFAQLDSLGSRARGKIIFFNRAMDPTKINTFEAYGGAVEQRSLGAVRAAKAGGVAALVRSMTLATDTVPHTGAMHYADGIAKIPVAAIATRDADSLSALLQKGEKVRVKLTLSCRTRPDVSSANVLGELVGREHPREVVVIGGHLDCWDKGSGAHDDGAGCVQAIEALSLLKRLGVTPRRTIRAVMFMNEENGLRGGKGYASDPARTHERHVALIESDRGGFAPRGFSFEGDSILLPKVSRWLPLFEVLGAGRLTRGYSGVDISPLVKEGIPGFGLEVENQRYFDYHHSENDTVDKVNSRELELGAIAEAFLSYLIAEEGI